MRDSLRFCIKLRLNPIKTLRFGVSGYEQLGCRFLYFDANGEELRRIFDREREGFFTFSFDGICSKGCDFIRLNVHFFKCGEFGKGNVCISTDGNGEGNRCVRHGDIGDVKAIIDGKQACGGIPLTTI